MDIREFINLVAAGNTEYDQLEAIARELQSVMPTDPAPTRTLRVWTLACDDNRNGTYASVHLTEQAAWENLVRLVTSEQDTVTREKATTFIKAKEYGELHAYLKNECFDLNDTYNVDYDDLELPGTEGPLATAKESSTGPVQVFDDRELATVLHALRCLQELRQKLSGTPADPGCTFSERYGCLSKPSTACDHFEDVEPLTVEEIDALCERMNLIPQPPSPAQTVLNAQFDAAYIAAGRRKLSGCLDDEYDILDNATVSEGNGGAFVSARVWVSHEDAGRCNGCGALADQLFEGKCRSCAGPPAYWPHYIEETSGGRSISRAAPLGRRRKERNAMDYLVSWKIDVFDAATPIEAAMQARKAQTCPDTIATVFTVRPKDGSTPVQVDLTELAEEEKFATILCSPGPASCTAAMLNRIK